jgi:hypothetical protein
MVRLSAIAGVPQHLSCLPVSPANGCRAGFAFLSVLTLNLTLGYCEFVKIMSKNETEKE